jgi:hypothetical protein
VLRTPRYAGSAARNMITVATTATIGCRDAHVAALSLGERPRLTAKIVAPEPASDSG